MSKEQYSFFLNQIKVNSVITNSGIFIGLNNATYWHTHIKQNNGFGAGGTGAIIGNTNLIIDNDVIDSPIDDREIVLAYDRPDSRTNKPHIEPSLTVIKFNSVNVNALNRNSTVAIGENDQINWGSHNKSNYGSGILSGENIVGKNLNIIHDDDLIDVPMNEQGYVYTVQGGQTFVGAEDNITEDIPTEDTHLGEDN